MECGLSYAVVLDEAGRFLKAANLGYQVGQTLDHVLLLEEKKTAYPPAENRTSGGRWRPACA